MANPSTDPSKDELPTSDSDRSSLDGQGGGLLSERTQRVYRASWRDFVEWCQKESETILPADPNAVARYLEDLASSLALPTLRNRLSAIKHYHKVSDLEDPTTSPEVADAWHLISEEKQSEAGPRPAPESGEVSYPPTKILREGDELLPEYFEQKAASSEDLKETYQRARETWTDELIDTQEVSAFNMTEEQRQLIPEVEYDLETLRDRALFLLMACGNAGRSEVVRLDVTDVVPTEDGIRIGARKKNGMPKRALLTHESAGIPALPKEHPAKAIAAWIIAAGLEAGPLFRSFDSHGNLKPTRMSLSAVNYRLGQLAEEAGLDPDDWSPSRLKEEPPPIEP